MSSCNLCYQLISLFVNSQTCCVASLCDKLVGRIANSMYVNCNHFHIVIDAINEYKFKL